MGLQKWSGIVPLRVLRCELLAGTAFFSGFVLLLSVSVLWQQTTVVSREEGRRLLIVCTYTEDLGKEVARVVDKGKW